MLADEAPGTLAEALGHTRGKGLGGASEVGVGGGVPSGGVDHAAREERLVRYAGAERGLARRGARVDDDGSGVSVGGAAEVPEDPVHCV